MRTLLAMTLALAMLGTPLEAKTARHSRHAKTTSAKKAHSRAGRHAKPRASKAKPKPEPAKPELTPNE